MNQKSQLQQMLIDTSNRINMQFKGMIQGDSKIERQDTLKGILHLVDQYRQILSKASLLSAQQKAKNYHVVHNTISYMTQLLSYIQKSSFSFESIKPLIDCILSIQSNLILADIKYLDKRTQLYINLCKIYEQGEYYQPVIMLIDNAIKKYEELKKIYELDPPVEKYVLEILDNNIFILKVMAIKFAIHAGVINVADWKKKMEEELKDAAMERKLICLVECLRTQTKKNANVFGKSQKSFKESLVQQGFDLVKPHLEILSKGLKEMKQKIDFEITFKQKTMSQTLKQDQINQQIKKKRQLIGKHIKQSQLKKACKAFPLQYHAELIYYAYQVKNHKVLEQLIRCGMIRVECRRIQVPYVTDVKIQVSNTPHINAKEGYEKIPIDLNDANLKEELKKLRKSGKTDPNAKAQNTAIQQPVAGKDAKKGGKQAPPPVKQQASQNSGQPTQWQLQKLNHKYVFMFIKRSFNPQNAIYDMKLVLGHEQKGPVGYQDSRRIIVPYIQKHQKVITSKIQQYKGMRESTQMVPYVILSHSQNSLQNQQEKKSLIVDVQPIIGKNPMVPARLGYTKLNMDLRQVPEEFIKMPGQSYIYLTYKNDYQFHLSSRLIELFSSFVELQNTYNTLSKQPGNLTGEQLDKYTQLGITYSLEKLDEFFVTFQETLKGLLGQEFYLDKNDFLTNLTFQVWKKYLQLPLQQIQYVMEQRLNEQIVDYDYELYKKIIEKIKSIFVKGLKVLNLVMVNNKKCDVLLLAKINLELVKMLEENKEYYLASQNARLGLDRVRMTRDQYLSKSVQAMSDRLLPFSITCQNSLISQTLKKMKQKFLSQRLLLQKIQKVKQMSEAPEPKILSQLQLQQAQLQWKLNRVKDEYDETVNKLTEKHSEYSALLSSIDMDLTNLYFRVALKHGEELKKRGVGHTGQFSAGQLSGLADTLVKKLGFLQTKSNMKQQQNLKQLQSTLIKAQKLPPPKPSTSRPQKRLIEQSYKNPYRMALLLVNLGALNSSNQDKKYYLKQSMKAIRQCQQLQYAQLQQCIQNSIFILSSIFSSSIHTSSQQPQSSPFSCLYTGTWPCSDDRAPAPIIIGKNSQTVYIKLPPFIYKSAQGKISKHTSHMKLYGKISANGVDVSTNCDELPNTGVKQPKGKVIAVTNLKANMRYCFAICPLSGNGEMMQIGKTSDDVPTFNPLPIGSIAAILAKVAYQIGEYQLAQQAAKIVVDGYTEKSNILDITSMGELNQNKLKLNQQKIENTSLLQIRAIAQTICVLALCEKRKLEQMKKGFTANTIGYQQKQRQIMNLLTLCASLQPALPSPITSIALSTSQLSSNMSPNSALSSAFMLSLLPQQFISPEVRKHSISVIRRLMAWGLQNNQVSVVRRILYKWMSRKFFVVGKVIQVAAEQKKDNNKKPAKDAKQPVAQQQKMLDKFCHYMMEKSPLVVQQFQDSLATTSDQYSDLLGVYTESIKQSIQTLAESTDNGQQKFQQIISSLTGKLQLAQFIKDPINSINKITGQSKYFVEYNCKLIRRALQVCNKGDLKTLSPKVEQFQKGDAWVSEQVKISLQIMDLIRQTYQNNIQFSPQAKSWVKFVMDKTQKMELKKTIEIYDKYQEKYAALNNSLRESSFSFTDKTKDYDYQHLWISQLSHLKALSLIMSLQNLPAKHFSTQINISAIYTSISSINLQSLKKKQKQLAILGQQKAQYDANSINLLQKIIKNLTEGIYSAFCIQNWVKFVNLATVMINFINFYQITPFSHQNSKSCWVYLSIVSHLIVEMCKKVRRQGVLTYKNRYNTKIQNTQVEQISILLQPSKSPKQLFPALYPQPIIQSFIPQLSNATSKQPWFSKYPTLQIPHLTQLVVYTAQTLSLNSKHEVIIQLLREFSNVTQHAFSLQLLPLMLDSQTHLEQEVTRQVHEEEKNLNQLDEDFENEKKKHKKKRTAQITGEKMEYQIQYELKRTNIKGKIDLLREQKKFVDKQMMASKNIVEEIQRDSNKAALSQKQQKRYVQQFGEDEQNIWKNYQPKSESASLQRNITQPRPSMNKLNILSKNRKNVLKDLISKYEQLYSKLKNNKTSKDTLSQILNRNEVGNLCYALTDVQGQSDNVKNAFQAWNDALATIFRKVNPIQNYLQILQQLSSSQQTMIPCYGFKQLLISLPIIYKISQFCCHQNLNLLRQTVQFSTEIASHLFKTSLIHPQHLLAFASYRLKAFDDGHNNFEQIIYSQEIAIGELTTALEYFIMKGYDSMDDGQVIRLLPLIVMYEHIVVDVTKSNQKAIKAKLIKSLILSRSAQIKQSSIALMFVAQQKDMPILWLQKSDNLKKQKGQNWCPQTPLMIQNKPFHSPQNKQPLQSIKSLQFPPSLSQQLSLQLPILFTIAKSLLLFKIYEQQIIQNFDQNQQRISNLKQLQLQLRESLRKLAVIEEADILKNEYQEIKHKVKRGETVENQQKVMEKKKTEVESYMKTQGGYDDGAITRFLDGKINQFRRMELIQHIMRTRFIIYKINQARNMSLNSFYIIKNGLVNFNRYSYSARRVQSGYDIQIMQMSSSESSGGAKKQDKKPPANKKQPQPIKPPSQQPALSIQQQNNLQKQASLSSKRTSPCALWHLKLTFQLGYLLYRQNNFIIALKIFTQLLKNSSQYKQVYFKLYAESYVERCKLRLGEMDMKKIAQILQEVETCKFYDDEYLKMVMDFAQIYQDKQIKLSLYGKGFAVVEGIYRIHGIQKYLKGINQEQIKRKYAVSDELTAEEEDLLKKKNKKPQDNNKKPPGKQDKKPAKKDDGKKKKEQSKVQYKANILKQPREVNLFQEQQANSSSQFRQYVYQQHPNFHPVNIYNQYGKKYIKCFTRFWQTYLQVKLSTISVISEDVHSQKERTKLTHNSYEAYILINKLLKIVQSYPQNNLQKLMLLMVKAQFEKQQFSYQLQEKFLKYTLSKGQFKKLKAPSNDLPLNSRLNSIPSYFPFLTQNLKYLQASSQSFTKLLTLIPSTCLILENDQHLQHLVYQAAGTLMLELQYHGTFLPKYMSLSNQGAVLQQKKSKRKLTISTFIKLLKYSIDLSLARKRLGEEYYTFSKKELDSNARIDEDIIMDIKNIDKECKQVYPGFLKQVTKPKENITSLDLLTYLLKIRRQSQIMTFSNPLQNTLRKCHRILSASLTTYKQTCVLPLPQLSKPQQNISPNLTLIKSKRISSPNSSIQTESYIYILGNSGSENQQSIIYGKFDIEMNRLSKLLENCYKIQSKLKQSATLSQAVRERNYKQLQTPFVEIMKEIIFFFDGVGSSNDHNSVFGEIIGKNLIKLSEKSILTMINLLNGQLNEESQEFNKFLKELHAVKYRLKEQRLGSTINSPSVLSQQPNEKTLELAK